MKRTFIAVAVMFSLTGTALAQDLRSGAWPEDDVIFEVIGQVKNAGSASVQYGYLPYINGLTLDQTFTSGGTQDERSAFFTFYNEGTTLRTVVHGLWRIVTREGTSTVYYDPTPNGDLATPKPETFRDGMVVMTSNWRHQVIFEPSPSGHFFVTFVHTITSSTPVMVNGEMIRLGKVGDQYKVSLVGGPDPAGLVNGKFAGNAAGIGAPRSNSHSDWPHENNFENKRY